MATIVYVCKCFLLWYDVASLLTYHNKKHLHTYTIVAGIFLQVCYDIFLYYHKLLPTYATYLCYLLMLPYDACMCVPTYVGIICGYYMWYAYVACIICRHFASTLTMLHIVQIFPPIWYLEDRRKKKVSENR